MKVTVGDQVYEWDGEYKFREAAQIEEIIKPRVFLGWLDDMDIVFCRNVLMYFDTATRMDVLDRIADTMAPDGLLILGENDTLDRAGFSPSADGPGFYAKSRATILRLG